LPDHFSGKGPSHYIVTPNVLDSAAWPLGFQVSSFNLRESMHFKAFWRHFNWGKLFELTWFMFGTKPLLNKCLSQEQLFRVQGLLLSAFHTLTVYRHNWNFRQTSWSQSGHCVFGLRWSQNHETRTRKARKKCYFRPHVADLEIEAKYQQYIIHIHCIHVLLVCIKMLILFLTFTAQCTSKNTQVMFKKTFKHPTYVCHLCRILS
jgi:hypothetical protein